MKFDISGVARIRSGIGVVCACPACCTRPMYVSKTLSVSCPHV
ncbi:hypothetical protein M6B38_337750 [Iris pallida]|uniref:Uncharacterized protein n=1 Tax=Iris pallida TaxID=29817 RepID=A0AAX6EEK3_IRIPA|nr:hypothetical protein M6B38_191920 [Iris pallida]KAJ6833624.1 hypothetical protein M6B38_337750 [Iris pallida]